MITLAPTERLLARFMTIPPPLPSPSLMVCYAEAQAALARLEERLRLSPVRQPLRARIALSERQALAAIDMADLPEEAVVIDGRGRLTTSVYDLTHWKHAIGMPITLNALVTDASALLQWFGMDMTQPRQNALGHREAWELTSAVEAWSKACKALPPSPALVHSGRIAALWRQHSPLGRGDVVASLLVGDRWGPGRWKGSQGGLTALGLKLAGGRWKVARDTELDRLWLDAIAAGANAHLQIEVQLRGFARRARMHLAVRRRPGRLKDLLSFAMARPAITSGEVARHLGLTSAGAIKLLLTAELEGLLVERTGQASYRSYMVPLSGPKAVPRTHRPASADIFELTIWDDESDDTGAPAPVSGKRGEE
ncbi:hypothetical protein NUH86_22195 (plasmid) [Sphingobium sp. JS3065]|nr:hypothetical protein [Sphingobium sp. JS3065]UZW57994.1 hypothetical protein NUH86_22195 [Sphingobium sp. JS3065]